VVPAIDEPAACALSPVPAGDEPDVATGVFAVLVAPVPAFELAPAFELLPALGAVLAATCGARRTSATVPVNG
jgi:hypothetical protein